MKLLIPILLTLTLNTFAQTDAPTTKWHFETNVAALSMRNGKSPLVGPSAVYRATEKLSLGARALMSLNGTSNESLATFNLLQRFHLNSTRTSLFIELSEAYNQTNSRRQFASIGTGLGLSHQISDFVSIGGLSGFECDLDHNGDSYVYPKFYAFLAVRM